MNDQWPKSSTVYDYVVETDSNTAAAHVIRMVGHDKDVLELGAGPGSISKVLAERASCRITAVELDPSCRDLLAAFADRVIIADLNKDDFLEELSGRAFDVIIVADVLEHLYNPWDLLPKITRLLRPAGSIVCSLPNAAHATILGCLASNNFDYRDWGLLDRTHIRFFGIHNIQAMFEKAGFYLHDAAFVTLAPEQTEFAAIWGRLSKEERACFQRGEFSHVYQIVVDARRTPPMPSAHALKLKDMTPPRKVVPLIYRLGGTANPYTNFVIQSARRWLPTRLKAALKRLSGR